MKILSTYFDSFTVARHGVVVCPSTMPRQMGYNSHDASQALANTRNNEYTSLCNKPGRQGIGFSTEIETQRFASLANNELESLLRLIEASAVARGLASRLRLKQIVRPELADTTAASPGDWLRVCD